MKGLLILAGVIAILLVPNSLSFAEETLTSKIWFITSDDSGCSNVNHDAIKFIESIAIKYLVVYGMEHVFFPPQCMYLDEIEENPHRLSDLMKTVDMPILITHSEINSEIFHKDMRDDHFQFIHYDKQHVVFCYCSIPFKDHTPGWQLSHQIAHYVLDSLGEPESLSIDWVHDAEKKSINCVNLQKRPGLCGDLWTPIVGNIPKEIMTVKVHPNYYTNGTYGKSSVDLSQYHTEYFKINESEIDSKTKTGLEKTNLSITKFRSSFFNGNQPIVFSGKLTASTGEPISNAEIIIKHDSSCPSDGIVAKGQTDKHGRFKIYILSQVWDVDDGLSKFYAVYDGDSKYLHSISNPQTIVVFSQNAQSCNFLNGL